MSTVRSVYGGPLAKLAGALASRELLEKMAKCLIDTIILEGKKDFAKRGWKLDDPMGGLPFDESFSFHIRGGRTIEIRSTYWGLKELMTGDIPSRRMTWLTQEGKDKIPNDYPLTRSETNMGMKRAGRVSKGERKPLVVPLTQKDGTVVFRTAPLLMKDAWIHPGIAKYTFMERAIRKGRQNCAAVISKHLKEQVK